MATLAARGTPRGVGQPGQRAEQAYAYAWRVGCVQAPCQPLVPTFTSIGSTTPPHRQGAGCASGWLVRSAHLVGQASARPAQWYAMHALACSRGNGRGGRIEYPCDCRVKHPFLALGTQLLNYPLRDVIHRPVLRAPQAGWPPLCGPASYHAPGKRQGSGGRTCSLRHPTGSRSIRTSWPLHWQVVKGRLVPHARRFGLVAETVD